MATPRGMRSKSIGHYILGKTIGEGTFGKVKLGTHILTGEKVAVKILEKERIVDVADVERVAREIHILKLVQHPHIIQLYEIIETPRQLYLIMEFCSGGELFDHIVEQGRVKEAEASRFFHQIMAGVEQIHRMNVVHRDLKPENLLLDEQKNIKIVDFGLSNTYQDGQLLKTACGSPCYAAPEMVAGQRYVPSRCDVWSCGVILFALVCGYLPFEDQNTSALYRKILNADYQAPKFISDGVRDLISRMLNTDPETRYTISKIRTHPWYRQIPEASLSGTGVGSKVLQDDVLDQLDRFGFPRDYAAKCLEMGKHNHVTTTYHLLLEKKKRSGGFLKALDQNTHAGFEGPVATDEIEVPAERTTSPFPYQGKSGETAMQDADRAAGGTGSPRGKTPEPGVPNYGNWAFPGQLPGHRTPSGQKRSAAREASEASTRTEHSYSGSGHVAPLSELTPRGAQTSRQPSRGSDRRPDMPRVAGGMEPDRGRKAQTPRGITPSSGTPTPGTYRSGTPNRRPFAGGSLAHCKLHRTWSACVLCLKTWKHFFRKTLTSFCSSFQACMAHFRHLTFASIAMTLYPPSSMFGVLELEVCWDSDLKISIEDEVIPVHPSVLIAQRSRFLSDLFGPDFTEATATVPVKPPHPELFLRALHSITTRARPELTEAEFVGFVRTSAFLQSDELDERLCEAGMSSWKTLTKLPEFRNPCVPAHFLERFLMMARHHEVMTVSDALEVLALWCKENIDGGDSVLMKSIKSWVKLPFFEARRALKLRTSLEPYSARESSRPGTSQGINGPTRPPGPATSRAQYTNEARRRHYAATPEAQGANLAVGSSTTPTTSSRGLRPAEGAAATAASVAADLFGGQAWTSVGTARSATPDVTHQDRSGRTPTPKDRDESMRTCRGAFNVACTSSKAPKQIMQEIQKALTIQRVVFKQANAFLVRCQKQSLRFEMEISHLDHLESIYVVRFRRGAGELTTYKELCSKVLAEMKI
eukprot:symbB.v1.2.012456.t2/scaffold858.1/size157433/4